MADLADIRFKPRGSPLAARSAQSAEQGTGMELPSATASRISHLHVSGMTCGNCARKVREAALTVAGVASADAQPELDRLTVWWTETAAADGAQVVTAVTRAGYPARLSSPSSLPSTAPRFSLNSWGGNTLLGVACTLPLLASEWLFGHHPTATSQWINLGLATVAWVGCGWRFMRGAWQQLKVGSFGMDLLVTLGSSAAYFYSAVGLARGFAGHLYFLETAAILSFISLGHWLEQRVSQRAEGALRSLLHLAPSTARRLLEGGVEREVPIGELLPGQLVVLRPGDRVPTDGVADQGESTVDESMLTGESAPVTKRPGDRLYAGTVNLDGRLVLRVTALGEATALARIIAAVRRAQSSRASIQRLADRVTQVFVPAVILAALGTGLWWAFWPEQARALSLGLGEWLWPAAISADRWANAVIHATAVLIIACPCAMGLATPAALMAAANAAARRGILLRDAVALEKAGQVDLVIFDKTGTLTLGRPALVGTIPSTPVQPAWLELAASLAAPSAHPLSVAVAGLSPTRHAITNWKEHRGLGTSAVLVGGLADAAPGDEVRLGSMDWVQGERSIRPEWQGEVERWRSGGATVLVLTVKSEPVLYLGLRDEPRQEAARVLQQLRTRGLGVGMISGDAAGAAHGVGAALGLAAKEILAPVPPEQKLERLRALQAQGHRVAFVGDGINDAPALAQADLGIAVTRASDVARESADLVLLRADLEAVPESLELASDTLRIIRQNLFWAFVYNALAVPLAALGFMNPMLCALSMGLSDVLVIGNSLRLLRGPRRKGSAGA